jgi:pyridoxal phosphate enzyme (YggS family)
VGIKENLTEIRARIAQAATSVGRDPEEIKLVVVTKTVPVELVEAAIQAGATDIGENRLQDAGPKIEALADKYPHVTWHMIGHLQRNKVKAALGIFNMIQSVDSERLAKAIEDKVKDQDKVKVLIEVNTSGEESKYGVGAENTVELLKNVSR